MSGTIVVGAQWGDEGKGKIVDLLSQDMDVVVRFNGGANAGHTVLYNGREVKLHQIPSGALNGKLCILGNGMVIDPSELVSEIENLTSIGINPSIYISDRAIVILPYHKDIDRAKGQFIGTTGRGIGPAYQDKMERTALRICDITHSNAEDIISKVIDAKRDYLIFESITTPKGFESYREEIVDTYAAYGKKIAKFAKDTNFLINSFLNDGKRVLFEGAQGVLLDIDFGTYPFVTSSNTVAQGAFTGSGTPFFMIERIIGITKAYTTRVGEGPFPTEIEGADAVTLKEKGNEYGATTGRPRRIGYLDLFALKYAVKVSGIKELAVTKIDVLSSIEDLKVAVAYESDGKQLEYFPSSADNLNSVIPIYNKFDPIESLEKTEWETLKKLSKGSLPAGIKKYISFIEQFAGVPVTILSYGPKRGDTIEYR